MSTNNNTVVSLKSAFLRTQTRILSQPLQAPERWKHGNSDAAEIPEKVVKDVIREVNRLLRRHNKSAYSSLALRHVAEQIDDLYWAAAAPTLYIHPSVSDYDDANATTDPLRPSTDLTAPQTIALLPPTWADATALARIPSRDVAAADAYATHVQRLRELDERRAAARARLARLKRMAEVVAPLRAPREQVQPHLVTREGELAREVGVAKTLGVRVAARLGAWAEGREEENREEEDGEWGERRKEVERAKLRGLLGG